MAPYELAPHYLPPNALSVSSSLDLPHGTFFDLKNLHSPLALTLPYTDQAQRALRHLHTIDLSGFEVTLAIPARIFDSDSFVPYTARHSHPTVDQARNMLVHSPGHTRAGQPVPGFQKFHVIVLRSNQQTDNRRALACAAQHVGFVDLLCTIPVTINKLSVKALVDTAANHSMIAVEFLHANGIQFDTLPSLSYGISGASAPCLGSLILQTCIGKQCHDVKYTIVASLPSAAAQLHDPNLALLGLDVISAARMRISFDPPRMILSVPPPAHAPHCSPFTHVITLQPGHAQDMLKPQGLDPLVQSVRQQKKMFKHAMAGNMPLYTVQVKSVHPHHICAASKKTYLSQQQPQAHTPQDTTNAPSCVMAVVNKHRAPGGTLGPAPPHTTALGFEMQIDTLPGARPKAARQYRLTPIEQTELEKQVKHLIHMGWITPSVSPWASCILFAPKPGGKLRLCIDYRYLNENTVKNTYPLPRIDTLLDKLQGNKFFSALDLISGYHQIRVHEDSQPKTAFRTPDGLYQWTVMPFGLTNAPSVFQQAMHAVLTDLIGKICLAYLDDIIIIAKTAAEHAQNLDLVLTRLHEHNFYCNFDKCQFALTEIKYLGHVVSADTVKPDPYKVQVLQAWPESDLQSSVTHIRSFLGLAGYFRRFIPKFPTLAAPLLERAKLKSKQPWTIQCSQAFTDIKNALINATGLRHPDLNLPFHVYTDASDYAYGAVLMQEHESVLMPVAWIGRKMTSCEVHHATFEKELGAIVFAARQWRCYLENNHPVYIHSDHNPLRYLQTQQKLNSKQARWVESLSRINWHITYVPGDKNVVADAVSRATHLPDLTVPLHDDLPISCVSYLQYGTPGAYPAVALTSVAARRSPSLHRATQNGSGSRIIMSTLSHPSPGPTVTSGGNPSIIRPSPPFRPMSPSSPSRDCTSSSTLAREPTPRRPTTSPCRSPASPPPTYPRDPRRPSLQRPTPPLPSPPHPTPLQLRSHSVSPPPAPEFNLLGYRITPPPVPPTSPTHQPHLEELLATSNDPPTALQRGPNAVSRLPPPPPGLPRPSPPPSLPTPPPLTRTPPPRPPQGPGQHEHLPSPPTALLHPGQLRPARPPLQPQDQTFYRPPDIPPPLCLTGHLLAPSSPRSTSIYSSDPPPPPGYCEYPAPATTPTGSVARNPRSPAIVDTPVAEFCDGLEEHPGSHLQATGTPPDPTSLSEQSDKHLKLDLIVDDFWARLRMGYAHDVAFRNPPKSYTFDARHSVYFRDRQLVVPDYDHLRRQILLWHHHHPWHAHMGIRRTTSLITDAFYWPGITNDIKTFVSQCHSCQIMKTPSSAEAVVSPLPVPSACWRIVSLDMITNLPRTSAGFDSIVVFVDQFSKMVRLISTQSTLNGPGFANLFFQNIYPHYGLPLGICSDRGVQWNNEFFKSLCLSLGITLQLTFSYHPRANGQVERLNRVIEEAARHFVGPSHDDWDTLLPHLEFSINSSKTDATGCTPFQLNRITPPLSPTALAFTLPEHPQPSPAVIHKMYYSLAKQSLVEAKQSMWSQCNLKQHWPAFRVGDLVLLSIQKIALHHPSLRRKFSPRWIGPCKILECIGRSAARIQLPSTLKSLNLHDVFHFSVLKPYNEVSTQHAQSNPVPEPPSAASFEVECIKDFDRSRPRSDDPVIHAPHFLVAWRGYDASHDLWLPADELAHCLESVADFLFIYTAPKQRERIIAQFPREQRLQLSHLVSRAFKSRRPVRDATAVGTPPVVVKPPRSPKRRTKRTAALSKAAPLASQMCSCCQRPLPTPSARVRVLDAAAPSVSPRGRLEADSVPLW